MSKYNIFSIMRKVILQLITIYQKTISLDHGIFSKVYGRPLCRFHPTCSEYTFTAVKQYGVIRGLWLGMKRVGRCHPWHEGGYDPVSQHNEK